MRSGCHAHIDWPWAFGRQRLPRLQSAVGATPAVPPSGPRLAARCGAVSISWGPGGRALWFAVAAGQGAQREWLPPLRLRVRTRGAAGACGARWWAWVPVGEGDVVYVHGQIRGGCAP